MITTRDALLLVLAPTLTLIAHAQVPQPHSFTYQGALEFNGQPANGSFDFEFRVFDASEDGTQDQGTATAADLQVANGLFAAELTYNNSVFNGDTRWLEIRVRPGASTGPYVPLAPRQKITATPYAMGLVLPTYSEATNRPPGSALFKVTHQGTTGAWAIQGSSDAGIGVRGSTASGTAISGYAGAAGGIGVQGAGDPGVRGDSSVTGGRGVHGVASGTGTAVGIWGDSSSPTGRGVVGAHNASTGSGIGVLGDSDSPNGIGVRGDGGTGVYGQGSAYGVRGHCSAAGAYAGYFAREIISSANALGTFGEVHMTGGSVGIGTNNPERMLHVAGDAILIDRATNAPSLLMRNTRNGTLNAEFSLVNTGPNDGYVLITDENHNETVYIHNDRVGIDTISPATPLHVGTGSDVTPTGGGFFMMGALGSTNIVMDNNEIMARNNGVVAALTLNVGGTTRVSVLEIAGADLAEKFPATEECKPGMVVSIDPANPGRLCLSRSANNRAVAGVVSGANDFSAGAVLGNLPGQEDAPPIALSGRVYVWCDATEHAIQPADLLTTSNTAGHAMKAVDYVVAQGAILGKAMSELKHGERGLVLVLVSLQ